MKDRSRRPIADHQCNEYKCRTCQEYVGADHICYLTKPESLVEVDVPPDVYGKKFYAFDFESSFTPHPTNPNLNIHKVNCVAVRQCYTDNL